MRTARAAVLVEPGSIEVRELPLPGAVEPGGGLLRVEGDGICGSDLDMYEGKLDGYGLEYPLVPGHEIVGTIERIEPAAAARWGVGEGDRVAVEPFVRCGGCRFCVMHLPNFCLHRRVYGSLPLDAGSGLWGGMAEYMVLLPNTVLHRLPAGLPVEDAVLFNPFANAFEWVCRQGGVRPGDRVLVMGAGQRGLACTIAAREGGASQVVVSGLTRDAEKLRLAGELGAVGVDVEREDLVGRVADLTGGDGVDLAIDVVPGDTSPIAQGIAALRPGGTLVLAGVKATPAVGLLTDRIHQKNLRVQGAFGTSSWANAVAVATIVSGRYDLGAFHTGTVGLDGVRDAIESLRPGAGKAPIHLTVAP